MPKLADLLFDKLLPGWKVRLTALTLALIGLYPCGGTVPEGVDPGLAGGVLCLLGVHVPGVVYTTMYALGLLGTGEKLQALVKSNNFMAAIEKMNAPARDVAAIEEAKPGATSIPGAPATEKTS